MIGVAVQPEERAAAAEFFELCKTPWEFCRDGASYDVLLCTVEPLREVSSQLRLVFGATATAADQANRLLLHHRPEGAMLVHAGRRFPVYGPVATFPAGILGLVREESTQEPVLFSQRAGGVTVVRVGYNLFAEIRHLLTQGQPVQHSGLATLELHLALLRDLITRAGLPLVEIPPVPAGHRFITCLTHDVDHPVLRNHCCDHTMFGFLYRATIGSFVSACRGRIPVGRLVQNWLAAARLPLVYVGLAPDFWRSFNRYLEIESGRRSTYFVIPEKDNPGRNPDGTTSPMRACRYELAEIVPQLDRLLAAGDEVGLHGLDAWHDAGTGRREQERLRQTISTAGTGVRMHWLNFDQNSPAALDEAGFSYDSTVGYNETVGYRAGTTQVYRPLGVKHLLELPLHVMDTALFYPDYLNLTEQEAHPLVTRMIDDLAAFGGVLTLNWHDRSIAPERLWGDFYRELLHEIQTRETWFATAAETVAWFRLRRSAEIQAVQTDSRSVTVRSRFTILDTTLPGLRIRLHKPHILILGESLASGAEVGFVDVPLNDTADLSITL